MYSKTPQGLAEAILRCPEAVEFGDTVDFFVLKLKDVFSKPALIAYAEAAAIYDLEYSRDVFKLAYNAGLTHPDVKLPD